MFIQIYAFRQGQVKNVDFSDIADIADFFSPTFINLSFRYSRKLGFKKIRDLQTSVFSIFAIGEYRKHGFIKVGEKNPRYPRHPRFRSDHLDSDGSTYSQMSLFVSWFNSCFKRLALYFSDTPSSSPTECFAETTTFPRRAAVKDVRS